MRTKRKRYKSINGWYDTIIPSESILSTLPNIPEDMDDWSCDLWRMYYDKLKLAYGKEYAIDILLIDSSRVGFFSELQSECKGDCNFINYFKDEGIPTGNWISDLYCDAGQVIDSITGAVVDVAGGVGGIGKGAGNAAKLLGVLMPIAVVGGLIYLGSKYIPKNGKVRAVSK